MNRYSQHKKIILSVGITFLAAFVLIFSCNKPFNNTLKGGNGTGADQANTVTRRTLLIVVDGAVGSEVRDAVPPVLNSLADFSIYSWDALNDFKNNTITNPYGWSSLLTGVNSNKNGVTGDDFSGNNFAAFPTIFTRLKQSDSQLRTSAFCSSPEVADNLAADATEKKSYAGDDAAVTAGAQAELASNNPSFMLVQFHSVDEAGSESSYSAASSEYKTAILQVDSYIGKILTAMQSRPSFKNENWMVIVTSNKGSNTVYTPPSGSLWSAFNDTRHNTFFFCYSPRFNSQQLVKPSAVIPYIGTSPYYNGSRGKNQRAKVLSGGSTYDIGSSGEFTIQCKVKFPVGNTYYPAFLSKRASFSGGVVGWVFFREGDFWQINFGQAGFGNRQIRGASVGDNQWHTLTAVIRQEGGKRNVYTYTDGVLYPFTGNRDISGYGNLNSPQPLTVGDLPPDDVGGLGNYFVTDIRFYNAALSDDYIANNFCKTDVDDADPYKSNLLGFWPSTSVRADKTVPDLSGNNHDLVVENYNSGNFNDATTRVCPPISETIYKTVPNSVDVAVQIYQWLGIAVPSSWNLDGKNWIPTYSDIGG
ncbi:MAG: DUF4983 domain-containing protein [Ginsengibacter sp.]